MNELNKVIGVNGKVLLKYTGELEHLALKLSKGLNISPFWFDNDSEPPFEDFAMCESLGFELVLRSSNLIEDYPYELKIRTTELFNSRLIDESINISVWLSQYISKICGIDNIVG